MIVASPALLETLVAVKFETFFASATAPLLTIRTSPVLRSLITTDYVTLKKIWFDVTEMEFYGFVRFYDVIGVE